MSCRHTQTTTYRFMVERSVETQSTTSNQSTHVVKFEKQSSNQRQSDQERTTWALLVLPMQIQFRIGGLPFPHLPHHC